MELPVDPANVGKHTYGYNNIKIMRWCSPDEGHLYIGKYCSIAGDVVVLMGGNHRPDWISTYPFPHPCTPIEEWTNARGIPGYCTSKGDVKIGNDVWIGQGVRIMSGVTIGDGAVIGSYSAVAKDVPPYAIAVGNPVQVKKYRFSEDQVERLQRIKWWEWSDEKVNDNVRLLCSPNIDDFIDMHD